MKRASDFHFLLLLLSLCALSGSGRSLAEDCRSSTKPVYAQLPSHFVFPTETALIRVETSKEGVSLYITTPEFQGDDYTGKYETLMSKDLGKTWRLAPGDFPSNLPGAGGAFIQAPSVNEVIYKWVEELGLYLRSDDHGDTWHLPRYSIGGVSAEDVASRLSGKSYYRLEFRLAAVDPNRPLTVYAGVFAVPWATRVFGWPQFEHFELPGLYVSHDGGESWAKFTDALRGVGDWFFIRPLGISPSNPNVMYGEGMGGILKSTDAGKHWAQVGQEEELSARPLYQLAKGKIGPIPTNPVGIEVGQIVIDPQNERFVYIVSNKGVYRTEDAGKTWCLLNFGFNVIYAYKSLVLNPTNPNEIFVGTTYGLFHSVDRGRHLSRIYPLEARKGSGR